MKYFLYLLLATFFTSSCSTNAVTGRRQLSLFPETTLQAEALTQYRSFLSKSKVLSNSSNTNAEMVNRVGNRLAKAIRNYYKSQSNPVDLSGYKWEFHLVEDKQANAWCMPGGKVVVYTGLLPITQNEAALAVVMGHEIAHALAQHGNERMSQAAVAQGLQVAGNTFTSGNSRANTLFNQVFAPGAQVGVLLPNSRKQELEADKYGLLFTAMAGYNPREAIAFWQRMASASGSAKAPQFLSTHPADETRITQLKKIMPQALKYYKPVQ